jgi:hypothetical protein
MSNYREAFLRVLHASYMMRKFERGQEQSIKQIFKFLPVDQSLDIRTFAGEVTKTFSVNYNRQSPHFRRWITGLAMPFGMWPIQTTNIFWRWMFKGDTATKKLSSVGIKGLGLLGFCVALAARNNGIGDDDHERLDYELSLPIEQRNRIHFNWKYKGKWYTYSPQWVIDSLFGAKLFSVLGNNLIKLYKKEITPKEFVSWQKGIFRQWADAEARGLLFGTSPFIKFAVGVFRGQDPLDGTFIYPFNRADASTKDWWFSTGLYFNKCLNPFFGNFTKQYYDNSYNTKEAIGDVLEKFYNPQDIFGYREQDKRRNYLIMENAQGGRQEVYKQYLTTMKEEEKFINGTIKDIGSEWRRSGLNWKSYKDSKEFKQLISSIKERYPNINEEQNESINNALINIRDNPSNQLAVLVNMKKRTDDEELKKKIDIQMESLKGQVRQEKHEDLRVFVRETGKAKLNKILGYKK